MAKNEIDVRRDNQADLFDPFQEFESMLDRFFGGRTSPMTGEWPRLQRRPATQVHENDQCYLLTAEVPGVPKESIDIQVNGNVLTIKAEHREESARKDGEQGYRRQFRSFQQSFSLPSTVDAEKIEAHCENGVLEIMLPKTERAQPKTIEVQSGKGGLLSRLAGRGSREESGSADPDQRPGVRH